jgi:hypothetical protein
MNSRYEKKDSYAGKKHIVLCLKKKEISKLFKFLGLFEWIFNIDRNQSWVTFLPRDLFEKEGLTFNNAVDALANKRLLAACYYIVAGPDNMNGAVVTRAVIMLLMSGNLVRMVLIGSWQRRITTIGLRR